MNTRLQVRTNNSQFYFFSHELNQVQQILKKKKKTFYDAHKPFNIVMNLVRFVSSTLDANSGRRNPEDNYGWRNCVKCCESWLAKISFACPGGLHHLQAYKEFGGRPERFISHVGPFLWQENLEKLSWVAQFYSHSISLITTFFIIII